MARPRPAFVRLHPADDPSKLHPVFFGHPDEFVPQPDPSKAGGQAGVGCSRLGLVALRAGRVPQRPTRLHITPCRGPCSPAPDTGRIERWGLVTDTPDGEDEDDGHAAHMAVSSKPVCGPCTNWLPMMSGCMMIWLGRAPEVAAALHCDSRMGTA